MITESQGKTAVESRLQMLERELDKTRTQALRDRVPADGRGTR